MDDTVGLRERKKAATRLALHEAALRLAAEQGVERLTVDAIADAAGVSRRTFSNYFSGKEEALFHGDAMWLRRLLELIRDQPAQVPPWAVLGHAAQALTIDTDRDPASAWLARRRQLRAHRALLPHHVAAYTAVERELAAELAHRLTGPDVALRSRVLAATFLATLRVAVQDWIEHPQRPLAEVIGSALAAGPPVSAGPPAGAGPTPAPG